MVEPGSSLCQRVQERTGSSVGLCPLSDWLGTSRGGLCLGDAGRKSGSATAAQAQGPGTQGKPADGAALLCPGQECLQVT